MPSGALPRLFCWSKFGAEAGEGIEQILRRKEQERHATNGLFFWGIGSSVAPGLGELLAQAQLPEVLFSPIKSRPRAVDVSPEAVVRWSGGRALDGSWFDVPSSALITGRAPASGRPKAHYALVCSSETPVALGDFGQVWASDLRNLVSGSRLGGSQVTAVVTRGNGPQEGDAPYVVGLRAALAPPYFIRLERAVPIQRRPTAVPRAA